MWKSHVPKKVPSSSLMTGNNSPTHLRQIQVGEQMTAAIEHNMEDQSRAPDQHEKLLEREMDLEL